MKSQIWIAFVILLGFSVSISFQNCSPMSFESVPPIVKEVDLSLCETCHEVELGQAACSFNGATVFHGESVEAFLEGQSEQCVSQERTCMNGLLSGSFQYAECVTPKEPNSCLFNGMTIAHGQSVNAYLNGNGTCESEERVCDDGVLSGSYKFGTCTPTAPCLFNGQTIAHGSAVAAFLNSAVPFGEACQQEFRVCSNGSLSGSYNHPTCEVGKPLSCQFNGTSVAHNQTVKAFLKSNVGFGETCVSEDRHCENGQLSGHYAHSSCVADQPQACSFNGASVSHGQTVTAYQNSAVPFGSSCRSQARTCNNGSLSGSYSSSSCVVGDPQACSFNGMTIPHGQNITAYQNSTVPFGSNCVAQTRSCVDGALSGAYNYASCVPDAPASCLFNGSTITHGDKVIAYKKTTVPFGNSCETEERLCENGSLSGSAQYGSCTVGEPASCLFNGQTLAHGAVKKAFKTSSVPFGSSCESEDRSCSDGALSGSFEYGSCSVGQPASCLFNGASIAHGQTVTAYTKSSVPFGSSCSGVSRTCYNGTLSGSAPYGSCSVNQPKSCLFNGKTIPHGDSTVAYASATVSYGESCSSETRTCHNGNVSGSYTHASCSVAAPIIRWVNSRRGESHMQTCARAGLYPSANLGDGICASGEARPTKHEHASSISYIYGKWGSAKRGGTVIVRGSGINYCYQAGQKRDSDGTDIVVAYLCSQVKR